MNGDCGGGYSCVMRCERYKYYIDCVDRQFSIVVTVLGERTCGTRVLTEVPVVQSVTSLDGLGDLLNLFIIICNFLVTEGRAISKSGRCMKISSELPIEDEAATSSEV